MLGLNALKGHLILCLVNTDPVSAGLDSLSPPGLLAPELLASSGVEWSCLCGLSSAHVGLKGAVLRFRILALHLDPHLQ